MSKKKSLQQEIDSVRRRAKAALKKPDHYVSLSVLIQYLDLAEEILHQGESHPRYSLEERRKMLGGFGKIALDDYDFAESPLGLQMFDVMNRFAGAM
jgi:hypothetical protein